MLKGFKSVVLEGSLGSTRWSAFPSQPSAFLSAKECVPLGRSPLLIDLVLMAGCSPSVCEGVPVSRADPVP